MDYIAGHSLHERATSGFPVSIGTALALESLFSPIQQVYDPNRQIPERVDVKSYQTCWINLTTLIRNLQGAVDKEVFMKVSPHEIAECLFEEIDVIQGLFANEGQGLCKLEIYYSTYEKLRSQRIQGLALRDPTTDLQKFYESRVHEVIRVMERGTDSIRKFNDAIKPDRREDGVVLSHQPYDLVHYNTFNRLDLLESHTGVLKPRPLWNTKYCPMSGQSFAHLPFHRKLLLIFGDRHLIKQGPLSLRKQVLETSLARHWTPLTTEQKIELDLGLDIRDPYMVAFIKAL
jgi:hypothetical protein